MGMEEQSTVREQGTRKNAIDREQHEEGKQGRTGKKRGEKKILYKYYKTFSNLYK